MIDPKHIPIELMLSLVAIFGGAARYLSGYREGIPFKLGMFLASIFVSGFSGLIFGFLGISMNMPTPILFIMAGSGGFFADQTMKLVMEWISKRIK